MWMGYLGQLYPTRGVRWKVAVEGGVDAVIMINARPGTRHVRWPAAAAGEGDGEVWA